jgi:alpha-1,2-mannosyltransferase
LETNLVQPAKSAASHRWQIFACLTILGLALTSNIESSAERAFIQEDDLIPIDFPVFYLGGKVALQRGAAPLYLPPADRNQGYRLLYQFADNATSWAKMAHAEGFPRIMQFTNPPFSAVLMAPLATMPWQDAYLLWQIITIVLTAASVFLVSRLLSPLPKWETLVCMIVGACFFFPVRNTLVFGQASVTILFAWVLGVYFFNRQKPVASGLCFALGTALKVAPIVAVPFFLMRRQWRWLAAYVAGVAAFTGVSIWVLGWQANKIWMTAIFPHISSGLGNCANRSLAGLVDALCGPRYYSSLISTIEWAVPPGLSLFEKACSIAIGLGFFIWCWRKSRDAKGLVDELVLLPLVYLLAAPFSWPHHFVLALLPLTYLWAKAREASFAELVTLWLSTVALGTELPMYVAGYSSASSSLLIIAAIALWPAATCALIWVGMRMYTRSKVFGPQPEVRTEAA